MKRCILALLVFVGMSTWTACPPISSGHSISLAWQDTNNAGAFDYKVYKSIDGGKTFQVAVNGLTVTNWTDTQVVSGQKFCYYVTQYNIISNLESGPSNTVCQVVP